MSLNFQAINQKIIANGALSFLTDLFGGLNGRQFGSEYCIGDIYGNRSKKGRGSLSINLQTGIWKDFSTNEKGGDLIDLYARKNNLSQFDAAQELARKYNIDSTNCVVLQPPEFIPVYPFYELPTEKDFNNPNEIYTYKTINGDIINYIRRWNNPKYFFPLTYGIFNGEYGWHNKQIPELRPLYGLETLGMETDLKPLPKTIVIVEGEKTANFLRTKIQHPVLTWSGGAKATAKTDWTPLQESYHDIVLWADYDANDASLEAMEDIKEILERLVQRVRFVNINKLFITKEGQDACDLPPDTDFNSIINSARVQDAKQIEQIEIPDGLIKETVEWIVDSAKYPQYNLAVLNTLAFLGSIIGRRFSTFSNVRANIFTVAIARTGAGKNHSRSCIEILAETIGCHQFIGQEVFRSTQGATRDLSEHPSRLVQMDEFGSRMKTLSAPESSATTGIATFLTQIYSTSHMKYKGGKLADPKAIPVEIESPNLNIFGTATEDQYADSLTKSGIENGQLNRFIVLPAFKGSFLGMERAGNLSPDVPKELAAKWRKLAKNPHWLPQSSSIKPDICEIPCTGAARQAIIGRITYEQDIQMEKYDQDKDVKLLLFARLQENTQKLALLFAISRNPTMPQMDIEDVEAAERIVKASINYMIDLAGSQISENSYHKEHLAIVKVFKQISKVTARDLTRRMQHLKRQERDSIIANLLESEMIERIQEKQEGSQKPSTFYKWIGK